MQPRTVTIPVETETGAIIWLCFDEALLMAHHQKVLEAVSLLHGAPLEFPLAVADPLP